MSESNGKAVSKDNGCVELQRKHRPTRFKDVIGQDAAVCTLVNMLKENRVPHALRFTGPSGCGKTTLAKILAKRLGCSSTDFQEINAASSRGIDMVRGLKKTVNIMPMGGQARVWLLDESHSLTDEAQTALLLMLENAPRHAYFMLATTHPQKLLPTIITRTTEIRCAQVPDDILLELLVRVAEKEGLDRGRYTDKVFERIVATAKGSPRQALVLLNTLVFNQGEERDLINAVWDEDSEKKGYDIAKCLFDGKTPWAKIVAMLKDLKDTEETTRRIILAYFGNVLLGGGKGVARAAELLNLFRDNLYDCGKPGLYLACYEACHRK